MLFRSREDIGDGFGNRGLVADVDGAVAALRDAIIEALRQSGLPAPMLELELTENALVRDATLARELLNHYVQGPATHVPPVVQTWLRHQVAQRDPQAEPPRLAQHTDAHHRLQPAGAHQAPGEHQQVREVAHGVRNRGPGPGASPRWRDRC